MKTAFISLIFITAFSMHSNAQDVTALRKENFNLDKNVALKGYDAVAYFKQNKAVKGNPEISATYQGVTYNFSSAENKNAFIKTPVAYEPQYGGWCAYAMGKSGDKIEVDPETFKIINGKLYLYYNKYFNNTLKNWNKDEANLKAKADINWQKIYH
jgi:YHS domain-containing protein